MLAPSRGKAASPNARSGLMNDSARSKEHPGWQIILSLREPETGRVEKPWTLIIVKLEVENIKLFFFIEKIETFVWYKAPHWFVKKWRNPVRYMGKNAQIYPWFRSSSSPSLSILTPNSTPSPPHPHCSDLLYLNCINLNCWSCFSVWLSGYLYLSLTLESLVQFLKCFL